MSELTNGIENVHNHATDSAMHASSGLKSSNESANKSANKANNISRKKDEKNIDKSSGNADLISSTELSKKGANKSVENDLELLEHAGKTPSEALQLVNNVLDSWSLISSYDATAQKQAHVPEPPIR